MLVTTKCKKRLSQYQIIFESYAGNSDYDLNKKNNANTPLHVASISKVLTSTALFRLIDKGLVQLDDLVTKVLPEFPYTDITFRMLLNHRSGLPHYAYFKFEPGIWDDSGGMKRAFFYSKIILILLLLL